MARGCLLLLLWCVAACVVSGFKPVVKSLDSFSFLECGQGSPLKNEQLIESLSLAGNCVSIGSCEDVLRCNLSATSGYYMIQTANGSSVQVYCDMEGINCGGEGGWMRVTYLDMTNPSNQCPDDFRVLTTNNKRFCVRDTSGGGCRGVQTETFGVSYTKICGFARGYAYHSPDAFGYGTNRPLADTYVDGVSVTYGSPPSHVWTYAAGVEENPGIYKISSCPCNSDINNTNVIPSYVGNDYYCEAGAAYFPNNNWHTSDPLWDGQQCGGTEGPCCNIPGLPWFNKVVSSSITASLEVRVCVDQHGGDENIGVEKIEMYIK